MSTARVPDEGHRARSYDEYPTGDHKVEAGLRGAGRGGRDAHPGRPAVAAGREEGGRGHRSLGEGHRAEHGAAEVVSARSRPLAGVSAARSEEHTSELQSLM